MSSDSRQENKDILEFRLPSYMEIPDVGLYLKQVVKYLNETLNPWFHVNVTETMISNYVKMHLVSNAVKKQYYRDQIAAFMFIVLAKPVVSLDNIQLLLQHQLEKYENGEAYELFRTAFMRTMIRTFGEGEEEKGMAADAFEALIQNIIIAIVQKYYIEKCFQELAEAQEAAPESDPEQE